MSLSLKQCTRCTVYGEVRECCLIYNLSVSVLFHNHRCCTDSVCTTASINSLALLCGIPNQVIAQPVTIHGVTMADRGASIVFRAVCGDGQSLLS